MASHLYVCVKCLRQCRIVGYVAPDFDEICDECRTLPLPPPPPEPAKVRVRRR